MSTVKKTKRPDSTRTGKAKALTIARKATRATYAKNGGRF